jgi:hypothetical protein
MMLDYTKDSISILGKKYNLEIRDNKSCSGHIHTSALKIEINNELVHENKLETLLHEIIHAISISTELDLAERQISTLSTCLYSVFRENGWIKVEPNNPKRNLSSTIDDDIGFIMDKINSNPFEQTFDRLANMFKAVTKNGDKDAS